MNADPADGAEPAVTALLSGLEQLREQCLEAEQEFAGPLSQVHASHLAGARNLVHYVALRRHDLRLIQVELSRLGLSSLGRSESHVVTTLESVIDVLRCLSGGGIWHRPDSGLDANTYTLERNADALLGPMPADRATRIMVTLPSEAAYSSDVADALIGAGMDIARINCAHDAAPAWSAMADHVHAAAKSQGRACRIAMDLAGPKVRTGPLPLGPPVVRVRPTRDRRGVVVAPGRVWLNDESPNDAQPTATSDVPVLPPGALTGVRQGDVISLRDARKSDRRLVVRRFARTVSWSKQTRPPISRQAFAFTSRTEATARSSVHCREPRSLSHSERVTTSSSPGSPTSPTPHGPTSYACRAHSPRCSIMWRSGTGCGSTTERSVPSSPAAEPMS